MKHIRLVFYFVAFLFLFSCGKNGEITTFAEQEDPIPDFFVADTIEEPEEGECPSCNLPDCCDCNCGCREDGTTTVDCDCEDETPEALIFFYDYLIDYNRIPMILPSLYENHDGGHKPTKACLTLSDNSSHWWLISQITGSLFSNTNLRVNDFVTEERNGTTYTYTTMSTQESSNMVVEIENVTKTPSVVGNIFTFDPYNFKILYNDLTYADPVMGSTTISGIVTCEGFNRHDTETDWWHTEHICETSNNFSIDFYYSEPYQISFRANIVRDGKQLKPEDLTINNGIFTIDGENYGVERLVPDEILECISRTSS